MATVQIVREDGSIREFERYSKDVAIKLDNRNIFEPAIVDRLEYDHSGEISKIHHENCVTTETRRESDDPPEIVIEGIVTENQLDTIKGLKVEPNPMIVSELYSGSFAVKRVTIEQRNDIVEYIPNGGDPKLAFRFQMQIEGAPNNIRSHPPEDPDPLFDSYEEYEQWKNGELSYE